MQRSIRHSKDFGPVLELVLSGLNHAPVRQELHVDGKDASSQAAAGNGAGGETTELPSLGNFDRLWEFLSQYQDLGALDDSSGEPFPSDLEPDQKENIDSTPSNLCSKQSHLAVQDLEHLQAKQGDSTCHLIKSQRRKVRSELHRTAETVKETLLAARGMVDETDSENEIPSPTTAARARIAVIQSCLAVSRDHPAKQLRFQVLSSSRSTPRKLPTQNGTRDPTSFLTPKRYLDATVQVGEGHLAIAAKRKANLLRLLRERFPRERKFLEGTGSLRLPKSLATPKISAVEGIHVFVDISNILIGFHDAFKSSLGISHATRIRHTPLSFHALSLILERGRPTSKRVVVGSDHLPSIVEARRLHYEINILERVHKTRDPSTRFRRQRALNTAPATLYTPTNAAAVTTTTTSGTSAPSSGSDTHICAHYFPNGPQRRVEQAVDEILHLKMLESVVDAVTPATVVLATGDAAEAEYSPGFRRMVERALMHGWAVELVSWTRSIGSAWREKAWLARWGKRFVVVELDSFLEDLKAA